MSTACAEAVAVNVNGVELSDSIIYVKVACRLCSGIKAVTAVSAIEAKTNIVRSILIVFVANPKFASAPGVTPRRARLHTYIRFGLTFIESHGGQEVRLEVSQRQPSNVRPSDDIRYHPPLKVRVTSWPLAHSKESIETQPRQQP